MLRFVLMVLLFTVSPCFALDRTEERYSVSLTSGTKLSVRAHKYTQASPEKLPVVFLFGGFEGAAHVLDLFTPAQPVYLVSFDYPYTPPRKFSFPEDLRYVPAARRAIHDTLEGIQAVNESLRPRNDLDHSRTTIVGASFGAPFALLAAAHAPQEFEGLVLIHGFGNIRETLENRLNMAWERKLGAVASVPISPYAAWGASWLAWLLMGVRDGDEAARALSSRQKVLLIQAESDQFIPQTVKDSLLESLKHSGVQLTEGQTSGGHLMPGADRLIRDLLSRTEAWMRKSQLL